MSILDGLSTILPIAATVAGSFFGMPWLGAAASGLMTLAKTGDLGKSVGVGALSYGLGSAASGLAGLGGAAAETTAGSAAGSLLGESGGEALTQGIAGLSPIGEAGYEQAGRVGSGFLSGAARDAAQGVARTTAQGSGGLADFGSNIARGAQQPGALTSTFWDNARSTSLPIAYGVMSGAFTPDQAPLAIPSIGGASRPYVENRGNQRTPTMPGPDYRPGIDPQWNYGFARGGIVGYAEGGQVEAEAKMALVGMHPDPRTAITRYVELFGPQALQTLKAKTALTRSGGITGPGDGQSDQVPAVVDGRKPVNLSTGEYVVPADTVSALGSGSTDAGVKKLDGMTQRVRQKAYGSKRQAKPVPAGMMAA